jgi:hypothetical protein
MTDLEELTQLFDLRCRRCGKAGADVFERPAELEAFLHPQPLTSTARRLDRPVQLRTIRVEDVQRIGLPAHRTCRPGWRPPERPERKTPPYDLSKSVALGAGLAAPDGLGCAEHRGMLRRPP